MTKTKKKTKSNKFTIMNRFYMLKPLKEIKSERLRKAGIVPSNLDIILQFGFNEVDTDCFDEECAEKYKNLKYSAMFNLGEFQLYIAEKIGYKKFDSIFDDEWTFYDDIVDEVQPCITTGGVKVDWVPGQHGGAYLVIYYSEEL